MIVPIESNQLVASLELSHCNWNNIADIVLIWKT